MLRMFAVLLMFVATTAAAPVRDAADDAQDYLSSLVKHASEFSGYDIPRDAGFELRIVTREWMGLRACPRNPERCPVLGLYDDRDVIYIVDGLPAEMAEHIAVHEIVHWLQHHSGKFSLDNCTDSVQREREAYQAQNAFIILVQNGMMFAKMPPMDCPE